MVCEEQTIPPTASPVIDFGQRFEDLVSLLIPFAGFEVFQDTDAPQTNAATWMAVEDSFSIGFVDENMQTILQRYLMVLLFYSTDGTNWNDDLDFLSEDHICEWRGVTCSPNAVITALDFDKNNLNGTIPSELAFLENLEDFNMHRNLLKGTLSSEFGRLQNLVRMNLMENMLTSTIPTEFGNMTTLTVLNLSENMLSKGIPSEIGLLTRLNEIDLEKNQLTGTIPVEVATLPILDELDLESNLFYGTIPVELTESTSLKELVLCKFIWC